MEGYASGDSELKSQHVFEVLRGGSPFEGFRLVRSGLPSNLCALRQALSRR